MTRMTHPKLPGQEIHVPEQAVDGNRRTGWQTDEDVQRAAPAEPTTAPPDTDKPTATTPRRAPSPTTSPATGKE